MDIEIFDNIALLAIVFPLIVSTSFVVFLIQVNKLKEKFESALWIPVINLLLTFIIVGIFDYWTYNVRLSRGGYLPIMVYPVSFMILFVLLFIINKFDNSRKK